MSFPIEIRAQIDSNPGQSGQVITIHCGLTVLLGPNGSGKTQLLRGFKRGAVGHFGEKTVRFLSAGRMGLVEQFRSDYDGHTSTPNYDNATYGSKRDLSRRHRYETLTGDFQTLSERADILIKIQERLRKLFNRDLIIEWDAGHLKILFAHLANGSHPYSSGREASGLMQLVGILAALYDDEVGVLLIDEPEVSLHPQLQSFLLKEILAVAGHPSEGGNKKIVIMATHSTEMLQITRPIDLLSLVFCNGLGAAPLQVSADAGELSNRKIHGLIARLGQDHKLALFCKRPLLVEGPSDVIVCNALAVKFDIHLEAAGSQVLPVTGKGQMAIVTKLLRLVGKEPVVLVDADGVADNMDVFREFFTTNSIADQDAARRGSPRVVEWAGIIFSSFTNLVDNRWNELAGIAEAHPYWVCRESGKETQAKRRAVFSILFSTEDEDLLKKSSDRAWVDVKNRLLALLDFAENYGLFVLRRGAIESYYHHTDTVTSIEKPSAAADEMDHILQSGDGNVEESYADILRCLRFASSTQAVCEAEALRDLLLSVAAPAHARLKVNDLTMDFNTLAKTLIGERSKLFDLTVSDERLIISINSQILDVTGFPLSIGIDEDVSKLIRAALSVNSK